MPINNLCEVARTFRAMNTGVEAAVCVPPDQIPDAKRSLNQVRKLFFEIEKRLSRFQENSELSQLNRSSGHDFPASSLLFEVVQAAVNGARLTGGVFDPTVLPLLESAGYNRSFETLTPSPPKLQSGGSRPRHSWQEIHLDPPSRKIFLPAGCRLDLGGIGKGWAADRACRYIHQFPGFAVNAGGDIRTGGTQADGNPWSVGIENPRSQQENLLVMRLTDRAVCTSTTTRRRWQSGDVWHHHIIDPRTGLPADSGVISATVIAGTAALAETISKSALILGPENGLKLIQNQAGMQGMLVLADGRWAITTGFAKLLGVCPSNRD